MNAQGELRGKVLIITGAASGIGAAAARLLASRGGSVALLDLDVARARDVAKECSAEGSGRARAFACDVSSREQAQHAIAMAAAHFGRVDVLVNCAGIFPSSPVAETTQALLQKVMAVNFYGAVHCAMAALQVFPDSGGVIVNVGSGAASRPIRGLSVYGASKAALLSFSRSLALELAPRVRVNTVSPGPTETPGAEAAAGDDPRALERKRQGISADTPMRRLACPAEVAEAIAYFASDRSDFITGQNVHVSGGRYMP